ncbi:MAG TPA: hypothetical protein VFP76_04275 [Gemmatimonadota bacterium]|nr:hypothetical protein [Gemmatimonadota bacterium]
MSALADYYAVPKQGYRSAIGYAESLAGAGGFVIVVHLARGGYLFTIGDGEISVWRERATLSP